MAKNARPDLKKLRRRAHLERIKKLRNPATGTKPPDPKAAPNAAPGSGVDAWRNES